MNMPRYLKDTEVAEITGIAVQTLRNDRHNRKGCPYLKISGRAVRYSLADVIQYMEKIRIETEAK